MEARWMPQQTLQAARSLIPTFSMSCIENPQKSTQFSSSYYFWYVSNYLMSNLCVHSPASVLSRGGLYVLVWLALTVLLNELRCVSVLRPLVRLAAFLNRKDLCDHLLDLSHLTGSGPPHCRCQNKERWWAHVVPKSGLTLFILKAVQIRECHPTVGHSMTETWRKIIMTGWFKKNAEKWCFWHKYGILTMQTHQNWPTK